MESSAGDQLTHGEDSGREDTYFLPKGVLEGKNVSSGDVLRFKVLGKDKDGNVEVVCMDGNKKEESQSWQDGLREDVAAGEVGSY